MGETLRGDLKTGYDRVPATEKNEGYIVVFKDGLSYIATYFESREAFLESRDQQGEVVAEGATVQEAQSMCGDAFIENIGSIAATVARMTPEQQELEERNMVFVLRELFGKK